MAKERTAKERRERTVRERAKTKARATSSSNAQHQCLEQGPMDTSLPPLQARANRRTSSKAVVRHRHWHGYRVRF